MPLKYSLKDKAAFYWSYFVSKVFYVWLEVERPKIKMFLYEMLYSASKFFDRAALPPSPFDTDTVVTKFGTFRISTYAPTLRSNCAASSSGLMPM